MGTYFIRHRGPRTIIQPHALGVDGMPIMAEQTLLQSERDLPPHFHRGLMEICYFVSGERLYHISGEMYKVGANQVFITWPDEIHWVDSAPYGKALFYYIRIALPPKPRRYMGLAPREAATLIAALQSMPRRSFAVPHTMRDALPRAFDLARGGLNREERLELSLLLSSWLFQLARLSHETAGNNVSPDIAAALGAIKDNVEEMRSVEELARVAGLSVSRFKAKFKEEIGLPPWEYVLRRKIMVAERLLRASGTSIRVCAEQVWPAFRNFPHTMRLAARSSFAVSSTMQGLFPPSSSVTGVKCQAADFITNRPTVGLPVKKI